VSDPRDEILFDLANLARRPYDFVLWAFPWGEAGGELESRKGPEDWQATLLRNLQEEMLRGAPTGPALSEAYQCAVRSGHDIGKSAVLSWLFWWGFSTREDTRGRATANTERQLRQILQPEIAKWHRLFIARDLFRVDATTVRSVDPERRDTWRFDLIPWSEENPEAFAGLHNYGKRIVVIFDEASGIHDKIWEVTDGVMHEADTELFWFCFGNPTKNYGRFYECWGRFRESWTTYKVDSRSVSFTNKDKINKAISQWGIESDYVKVRYLGDFPDASTIQLIPVETIRLARTRDVQSLHHEPLILSLDVARFGSNESVLGFRRGKDARSIPVERWRGLSTMETADRCAARILTRDPDAVFVDEGGVGGGVVDRLRQLGHSVIGVNFGSKASGLTHDLVGNKRAEMYVLLRDWLREGGCVEDSDELEDQLVAIEYYFNKSSAIMLTAKEDMEKDGFPSPDWADQLAISFAYPVSVKSRFRRGATAKQEYDPYSMEAFREGEREPALSVAWEQGELAWRK
jgi:hypothetical protein